MRPIVMVVLPTPEDVPDMRRATSGNLSGVVGVVVGIDSSSQCSTLSLGLGVLLLVLLPVHAAELLLPDFLLQLLLLLDLMMDDDSSILHVRTFIYIYISV